MSKVPWIYSPYFFSRPEPMFPIPPAKHPHSLGFLPPYIKKQNTVKIDKPINKPIK